jgi:hypothetical protein
VLPQLWSSTEAQMSFVKVEVHHRLTVTSWIHQWRPWVFCATLRLQVAHPQRISRPILSRLPDEVAEVIARQLSILFHTLDL